MGKAPVSFSDFAKFDFRVGKVISAQKVKESNKLIRMKVDLGPDYGVRTIFAGIAPWYNPSQLKNKKLIIVANLEPKMMFGEESQGMMMAADIGSQAVLLPVNKSIPEGSVVR
jgi:methionyl-tRNA synthetase